MLLLTIAELCSFTKRMKIDNSNWWARKSTFWSTIKNATSNQLLIRPCICSELPFLSLSQFIHQISLHIQVSFCPKATQFTNRLQPHWQINHNHQSCTTTRQKIFFFNQLSSILKESENPNSGSFQLCFSSTLQSLCYLELHSSFNISQVICLLASYHSICQHYSNSTWSCVAHW